MNVKLKKILIASSYIVVIIATVIICNTIQRNVRDRSISEYENRISDLEKLGKERDRIDTGFRRTIETQRRNLESRRRELRSTNRTIERLTSSKGSASESIGRLEAIHKELELRNRQTGK